MYLRFSCSEFNSPGPPCFIELKLSSLLGHLAVKRAMPSLLRGGRCKADRTRVLQSSCAFNAWRHSTLWRHGFQARLCHHSSFLKHSPPPSSHNFPVFNFIPRPSLRPPSSPVVSNNLFHFIEQPLHGQRTSKILHNFHFTLAALSIGNIDVFHDRNFTFFFLCVAKKVVYLRMCQVCHSSFCSRQWVEIF